MQSSSSIQIPPQWKFFETGRISGTVMVIGAPDSGKSTLVRWLLERICKHHRRTAWLDGDIGQSALGPPTTVNLALINEMPAQTPKPNASFFVGATSPL